jgi:hypothetical protein
VIFAGPIDGDRTADDGLELPIDSDHDGGYGPSSAGDLFEDGMLADTVIIGAPDAFDSHGAVYVYLLDNDVPNSECLLLQSPDTNGFDFGWTVAAIPGSSYFLVGEPNGSGGGKIYVFHMDDLP